MTLSFSQVLLYVYHRMSLGINVFNKSRCAVVLKCMNFHDHQDSWDPTMMPNELYISIHQSQCCHRYIFTPNVTPNLTLLHTGVKPFTPNVTPCDAFHTGVHTSAHAGVHTGVSHFTPVRTPCNSFSHQRAHQCAHRWDHVTPVCTPCDAFSHRPVHRR